MSVSSYATPPFMNTQANDILTKRVRVSHTLVVSNNNSSQAGGVVDILQYCANAARMVGLKIKFNFFSDFLYTVGHTMQAVTLSAPASNGNTCRSSYLVDEVNLLQYNCLCKLLQTCYSETEQLNSYRQLDIQSVASSIRMSLISIYQTTSVVNFKILIRFRILLVVI